MARLLEGPALQHAIQEAAATADRAWLASGFIKSGFLARAGAHVCSDLQVFARWRLSDLVAGASDVEAAREALSLHGSFSIHPRLHAKVFLFDNTAFVGSANLTASGLPTMEGTGNLEAALVTSEISDIVEFIENLRQMSLPLSNDLVNEISQEVEALKKEASVPVADSYTRMPAAFERSILEARSRPFTGADFPWCEGPAELMIGEPSEPHVAHDLELFALSPAPALTEVRRSFLQSRCYAWLTAQTREYVRFGELTALLHDALAGDPRPYRRDVKNLLSRLLAWARECDPDSFHEQLHQHTRSYRSSRQ